MRYWFFIVMLTAMVSVLWIMALATPMGKEPGFLVTSAIVTVAALATGVILHRVLRGPKTEVVSRAGEEPFQAFRMRTVGTVLGPIMLFHNNDLMSLRLYQDHLDLGAIPRRSYPYGDVEKIEYSTLSGNALRLRTASGSTWSLVFYDTVQLQSFLDALRGRVRADALPAASSSSGMLQP